MAWVRSEQALLKHPKTLLLKALLKIDMDAAIGRLHMLWWWCLDYALDGDLSKHSPKVIEDACQVPLKVLYKAGFVDSRPYRRIHDWWDNQGNYLKVRFKDQPDKWSRIKLLYERKLPMGEHQCIPIRNNPRNPVDVDLIPKRTYVANVRTDVDLIRARGAAPLAPPGRGLPALTKVDADDMPQFGHEDFQKAGWRKSDQPQDKFGWEHLERTLSLEEKVQSKLREKSYQTRKWN